MEETQATAVLSLMFALRCIAPLLLTLAIGYLMNKLVDRWEAEETADEEGMEMPSPTESPVPAVRLPSITVPCWILKNCEKGAMADCPACKQPGIPCWLARLRAEGAIPETCPDCPIYEEAMPSLAV